MRLGLLLAALGAAACGGGAVPATPAAATPAARTWAMGFASAPPRPTTQLVLQGIDLWSQRAEIAAIHEELPWTDLLAGMSPEAVLDRDKVQLVSYLRGKGLALYFMAELDDGLSRSQEAPQLRALGRSITEPAVQQLYRSYVLAVARKLAPEYIGLVAETNLIRAAAPPALYAAAVTAANAAAADLRAAGSTATLLVSVQVESAWGLLGSSGPYVGVEQDFRDFPFLQLLGLSSYPYFAYAQPEDLPADYYRRLLNGRSVPLIVVEGGWSSASVAGLNSSPDLQARYVTRHEQLLDGVTARGVIQLLYADLDLQAFPPPIPANLPAFAQIGLADSNFVPKPALAAWDRLHARPLRQ